MAGYFELFDWHFAVSGEEQNIPIVEPHCSCRIESAQPVRPERYSKKVKQMRRRCLNQTPRRVQLGRFDIPRMAEQGRFKFVNTITLKIGGYQVAGQRYRPIFKPAAFNSTGSEQLQNWQQHVQSPGLIDRNLAYPLKSSSSLLPKMFQLPWKRAKRA